MRASNPSPRPHSIRGFALLEVMLAVVVLAIGLLALAALQAATIRSSAAAKAQTTAISLTKDQVERMQGFATLNGYRDLAPKAKPSVNDVLDSTSGSGSLGGVDYKRWWDVERYVYNGTGFVNVGTALVTATNSALTAANANYVPGNEFKRIRVNVAWVDATGTEQTVSMEDAIAAINPAESSRIIGGGSTGPRGPQVRISNPQNEAGVIPVAIGDGSDTAATNPKPKVLNSNAGTTFDVLTYTSNDGSAAVVARQRVETTVVGCTCDFGNPAAGPAYRPSYWNGFRYTAPKTAAYTPPAGPATGVTQSALCTQCCRDHHDPAGDAATASGAKFDPRRNSHDHARLVSGVLTNVTAGRYREACRV
ncbi:MAG: prepilin-type N-terminal cleavage/methylation domain-containing protein, partial [Pseudomonadota bacterium]|nr:prepilin-type N-terminal cleavage/methylation domain-containing protein [Pseudomonadota bacterium]